jgi:hypothetical protein
MLTSDPTVYALDVGEAKKFTIYLTVLPFPKE